MLSINEPENMKTHKISLRNWLLKWRSWINTPKDGSNVSDPTELFTSYVCIKRQIKGSWIILGHHSKVNYYTLYMSIVKANRHIHVYLKWTKHSKWNLVNDHEFWIRICSYNNSKSKIEYFENCQIVYRSSWLNV